MSNSGEIYPSLYNKHLVISSTCWKKHAGQSVQSILETKLHEKQHYDQVVNLENVETDHSTISSIASHGGAHP